MGGGGGVQGGFVLSPHSKLDATSERSETNKVKYICIVLSPGNPRQHINTLSCLKSRGNKIDYIWRPIVCWVGSSSSRR